jgi:hypothetical protein
MQLSSQPFDVISVAILGASTLISALMLRLQVRLAKKVDADNLAKRVETLETRTASMPTHADLATIGLRLGTIEQSTAATGATVQGVSKALDGVSRQLEIIQEHLLDGKPS